MDGVIVMKVYILMVCHLKYERRQELHGGVGSKIQHSEDLITRDR